MCRLAKTIRLDRLPFALLNESMTGLLFTPSLKRDAIRMSMVKYPSYFAIVGEALKVAPCRFEGQRERAPVLYRAQTLVANGKLGVGGEPVHHRPSRLVGL